METLKKRKLTNEQLLTFVSTISGAFIEEFEIEDKELYSKYLILRHRVFNLHADLVNYFEKQSRENVEERFKEGPVFAE